MPLGPLTQLPLKSTDFASVCFTAGVPERHLRLVIVRLVPSRHASTDYAQCRSTALLVDARSPVTQLRKALFDAVRSSMHVATPTLERSHLYTRISGSVVPVDTLERGARSVADESTVPGGCLRGSSHLGNALHAYQKHCEHRTRLCIRRAQSVYAAWQRQSPQLRMSPDERHFSSMYIQGLARLGVANPTQRLPADCVCSGRSDCDCFMRRALWRAGNMWLIFYVVTPPTVRVRTAWQTSATVTAPPALASATTTTTTDEEWIAKLVEGEQSEDRSRASPLDSIEPSSWHRTTNEYLELTTTPTAPVFNEHVTRLLDDPEASMFALDVNDDSESSSSTCSLSSTGLSLIEAAAVWALEQRSHFLAVLADVASHMSLYYRVMLQYVLSKAQRRHFVARTVRRSRQMARTLGDAQLMCVMRPCDSGVEALVAAVSLAVGAESEQEPRTLRSSRSTGYALVVMVAVLLCCDDLNRVERGAVTTWPSFVHVVAPRMPPQPLPPLTRGSEESTTTDSDAH